MSGFLNNFMKAIPMATSGTHGPKRVALKEDSADPSADPGAKIDSGQINRDAGKQNDRFDIGNCVKSDPVIDPQTGNATITYTDPETNQPVSIIMQDPYGRTISRTTYVNGKQDCLTLYDPSTGKPFLVTHFNYDTEGNVTASTEVVGTSPPPNPEADGETPKQSRRHQF